MSRYLQSRASLLRFPASAEILGNVLLIVVEIILAFARRLLKQGWSLPVVAGFRS
jgi:hypothetical protein